MSASDDAINPAKEVRLSHPPPPPKPARPAEPLQDETSNEGLSLPSFVYMALLITFLLLGIVFLRMVNHRILVHAATPAASTATAIAPAAQHPRQPNGAATRPAASDARATMVVAPPAPPPLRLQAVFYSPTKPSAIISGTTVGVGDRIRGFLVLGIGKDSVTLSSPDETKVLKMQ